MAKIIHVSDLPEFDMAEHLQSAEDIAAYLSVVLEEGDMAGLICALSVAARAKGMTEVAKTSGMTREGLYKALRPDAQPRFETVARVCKALGVRLHAEPLRSA